MLSADFGNLQRDTEMVNRSQADWFHVDIMDGVFVPNISFGFPVVKSLFKHAQKPLDVHLMIVQPERYIKAFKDAGAAVLTIHLEASTHLHRSLDQIRQEGMKAGVALNPHSPVHLLEDIISSCDLVCLMSVNPGFGGQSFIEHTYRKINQLRKLIQASNSHCLIEIDGGVTLENAPLLLEAGADVLVAGNTVFGAADPVQTIAQLKSCAPAHTKA
ncbi:MAG: hypothetical protein RLZZ370_1890 [Bacteroidota bacterium]|jgi:ribulose-phosphate 3-epimerase